MLNCALTALKFVSVLASIHPRGPSTKTLSFKKQSNMRLCQILISDAQLQRSHARSHFVGDQECAAQASPPRTGRERLQTWLLRGRSAGETNTQVCWKGRVWLAFDWDIYESNVGGFLIIQCPFFQTQ